MIYEHRISKDLWWPGFVQPHQIQSEREQAEANEGDLFVCAEVCTGLDCEAEVSGKACKPSPRYGGGAAFYGSKVKPKKKYEKKEKK